MNAWIHFLQPTDSYAASHIRLKQKIFELTEIVSHGGAPSHSRHKCKTQLTSSSIPQKTISQTHAFFCRVLIIHCIGNPNSGILFREMCPQVITKTAFYMFAGIFRIYRLERWETMKGTGRERTKREEMENAGCLCRCVKFSSPQMHQIISNVLWILHTGCWQMMILYMWLMCFNISSSCLAFPSPPCLGLNKAALTRWKKLFKLVQREQVGVDSLTTGKKMIFLGVSEVLIPIWFDSDSFSPCILCLVEAMSKGHISSSRPQCEVWWKRNSMTEKSSDRKSYKEGISQK